MSCIHKFHGHSEHLDGDKALIPRWEFNTLIVGTFNPEIKFHPKNAANYFYGRRRNYFWKILPKFCGLPSIPHDDIEAQIKFLKKEGIGLTDLLVSINDADVNNPKHIERIQTVLDRDIETFTDFTWNTPHIISLIETRQVKAVYFTKLGIRYGGDLRVDTFEFQMRVIEGFCDLKGILCHRLFTPSGNGLGVGRPKENHLINRWYKENGGSHFPFISESFKIEDFPFS
jgi:hypothetical protein